MDLQSPAYTAYWNRKESNVSSGKSKQPKFSKVSHDIDDKRWSITIHWARKWLLQLGNSHDVDDITYGIIDVNHDIAYITYDIVDINYDIADITYDTDDINYDIGNMAYDIADINYDIAEITYGIADINYDTADIAYDTADISFDITDMLTNDDIADIT